MLQLHPDSTCDVCFDTYVFSNPAKNPHAIDCGHVFCLECLTHLDRPKSCPLCRQAFGMDRIKKLHVDRPVHRARDAAMPDVWGLVQRLSRCTRDEVNIQATGELLEEARRWLEVGNHKELFSEVDAVFSALIRYKALHERFHDQQATMASLTAKLQWEEAMRDEGTRNVEHSLTRKIKELETQLDVYRKHANRSPVQTFQVARMIYYLADTSCQAREAILDVCELAPATDPHAKKAAETLRSFLKYGREPQQLSVAKLWAVMLSSLLFLYSVVWLHETPKTKL